jgi:hypothetical protein
MKEVDRGLIAVRRPVEAALAAEHADSLFESLAE